MQLHEIISTALHAGRLCLLQTLLFFFLRVIEHYLFDPGDRLSRIQAFRTSLGAIENRVAAVERVFSLQHLHTFEPRLVARVHHPAVRLHENGGSQIPVSVPPVAEDKRDI